MSGLVRFDHVRAARTVAALERVARMVEDHAAIRARLARRARLDWRGRHAVTFDDALWELQREAAALAADLRRAARALVAAAEAARAEERRRAAARDTGAPWGARVG